MSLDDCISSGKEGRQGTPLDGFACRFDMMKGWVRDKL